MQQRGYSMDVAGADARAPIGATSLSEAAQLEQTLIAANARLLDLSQDYGALIELLVPSRLGDEAPAAVLARVLADLQRFRDARDAAIRQTPDTLIDEFGDTGIVQPAGDASASALPPSHGDPHDLF